MSSHRIQRWTIHCIICYLWVTRLLTRPFETTTTMLRYNKVAQMAIARRNIIEAAGTAFSRRNGQGVFLPSRVLFSNKATSVEDSTAATEINNEYTKSYKLQGVGVGPTVDVTTNTGHTIRTDLPKKMGGTDLAPQPVEMLLTAWMGCTQATALFVGRHMEPTRLVVEKIQFDNIQGYRDERGALQLPLTRNLEDDSSASIPSRLQRVTGTIYVFAKTSRRDTEYVSLSNDQLDILKHQTETRCPVANMMITSGCVIDVEWLDGSIDRSI